MTKLSIDQVLLRAKSHLKEGNNAKAQELFEAVLRSYPRNKRAQKGLIALGKKQHLRTPKIPSESVTKRLTDLYNQGQLSAVIAEAESMILQYPEASFVWNILGAAAAQLGNLEQAINAFRKVIALEPNAAEAYNNLGNALNENKMADEAIEALNIALKIRPDYFEAYYNMGNALHDLGRDEEAISYYEQAIRINPNYEKAYCNLGVAKNDLGDSKGAMLSLSRALELNPFYPEAHLSLAIALNDQNRATEAINSYRNALKIRDNYPKAHYNLSFLLLNCGEIWDGLNEYEWRLKLPKNEFHNRRFLQPLWDGEVSLEGKRILVWADQGVGDTINWSIYLPLLASRAKHCILECQDKLIPLLSRSFPDIEIKPENKSLDAVRTDFDFHIPMGSLYRQFFATQGPRTHTDPFLIPDPIRVSFWKERLSSLGDGPYIGISWKSSVTSPDRMPNYAPLSEWSPLFTLPNVTLVNLQYKDFESDLRMIKDEFGVTVHNFEDLNLFDDLNDVAALCAALDFVVSTTCAVPLISAGVGTSTKLASWKQSPWNNSLFHPVGPLVEHFERNTWEPWEPIFKKIAFKISEV